MIALKSFWDLFEKTTPKGFYIVNQRIFVKQKDYIFELPFFYHDYSPHNCSRLSKDHTFKGTFSRHVCIESILISLRCKFRRYLPLDAIIGIFFGLNCNFPLTDVARFFIWQVRGEVPLHFFLLDKNQDWLILDSSIEEFWRDVRQHQIEFHL